MRNRGSIVPLLLALSVLAGISCKKEEFNVDLLSDKWKVDKMKIDSQLSYESADGNYILEFKSHNSYTLNLSVNYCSGEYLIIKEGEISIEPMACTEVCCDNEFAVELSALLPKMNHYYGRKDALYLEGKGRIILKRHK